LQRTLQVLGLSPNSVLRQAGQPMGLFKLDKILVSTEECICVAPGNCRSQQRSWFWPEAGDRGAPRAVRPGEDRRDLRAVVSGRCRAVVALQTTHLSRGDPRSRTGQ